MTDEPIRSVWRALIRFEPQKIVPEVAVRNTIGFTLAVIIGTVLASPSTGVVAGLGALNVCYSDGTDPYQFRARRMLIATLLVGAAVVFGALSAHSNVAAVTVAAVWAFAAGMLVALGSTAGDIGVVTLVTLVVFAAKPLPVVDALEAGAVAAGGGLLQTLLSTFLWPVRRYEPEQRIIGAIYGDLSRIAEAFRLAPPSAAKAPPMTRQISDARDALAPLDRDHGAEAERQVFLLLQAERIRLSILNAGRLQRRLARDDDGREAATAFGAILEQSSAIIGLIGQRLRRETVSMSAAISRLTADVVAFHRNFVPGDTGFRAALLRDVQRQSVTLRSQIRSAAWAASGKNIAPAREPAAAQEPTVWWPWRLRFEGHRARLLANLSLDSTVFRHAVRMALCLAVGDAIGRSVGLQRTYWIPMTIAIVLKPDFTGTFARGVLRIGGTMAGLVLATLLFRFIHGGVAIDIALMALFTLLLRWTGPANYGIFVIAVSALVVLMISVTGVAPGNVIAARAMNTALGGSLALLAYAVWPTWEKTQTRAVIADLLDSYRAYTDAVLRAYAGEPVSLIDAVRARARRVRSNSQASVDRTSGEPGVTAREAASLNAILVSSHSFVHAVMAMESRLYRDRRDPAPAWLTAFGASVERSLRTLSAAVRNPDAMARRSRIDVETPVPGTGGNELMETEADRVRTSLRSLGEEIAKRDWL